MASQTRATAVAFIAARDAAAGEPSYIVGGSRLDGGRCRQFIGFFDAAGLETWLAAGGKPTPDDQINCVFQSFRKDGAQDRFYLPWAFEQSILARAGLFEAPNTDVRRTIRVPGLQRIAYFVDGRGADLQPFDGTWAAAQPRLVLDLANPGAEANCTGSSLLIVLRGPSSGTRVRPDYLIVDHRLRHPLTAHAAPTGSDDRKAAPRTAAALQTWHANVDDPWVRHGDVHYPQLAFWAAGVSERNWEDPAHPDRAWKTVNGPKFDDQFYAATTLYALATDKSAGSSTLEGALRRAGERPDPEGMGIPALAGIGLAPYTAGAKPLRTFGLQRVEADEQGPVRLEPVLGGEFALFNPVPGVRQPSLELPSGFSVSRPNKLDNRRVLRAQRTKVRLTTGPGPDWLKRSGPTSWRFSLMIEADDLDLLPTPNGPKAPLAALFALLSERGQARAIARGQPPFSFAPDFPGATGAGGLFRLDGELVDSNPNARRVSADDLSLDVNAAFRLDQGPGQGRWPALLTHDNAVLAGGDFSQTEWPVDNEETELAGDLGASDDSPRSRFLAERVVLRLAANVEMGDGPLLRFDTLDLQLRPPGAAGPVADKTPATRLTIAPVVARIGGQVGMRVRVVATLPVSRAIAAEPGRPPLDRDLPLQAARLEDAPDRPLLLPLPGEKPPSVSGDLHVTETFGWGLDPELQMWLSLTEAQGGSDALERWMVVGRLPMQVARLHFPRLSRRADATDDQVAVWSSGAEGGGSWRLRDPDQTAQIVLPPQGVGEAMEKGRGLDGYDDLAEDTPADFRFTPPALIEVDPSPLDSGFVEPAWSLDRIFNRPGEIEPGAALRRVAYELLYGMAGAISDRGLKDAQLRLSDVAARYGVPPNRLTRILTGGDRSLQEWIDDFNGLRRTVLTRPMALSLTRTDRAQPFEIDGAGIDFRLRTSARLKYPIPGVVAPESGPWKHVGTDGKWSDEGHLAGGVGWAFESRNIVESVYARPRSNAGRVRELVLTPLGGYGNVRGLFDNRRTAIEATVGLGRTHFYALERSGRIGALWSRAKHVIIYRREVVPSAQFYNERPIGHQQDELAGRVVLRKWDEYIEVLQPERRYPDLADSADRAGFLRAAKFHSRRIKVDSRWGVDVPGAGWMVPLWRSVFRDLKVSTEDSPAAIYPQPHISLVCAGRDGQEHEQEVRYPENLVFFASTRPGETDDTDAWAVTEGVDWCDEAWPEVFAEHGSGGQPYDTKLAKPVVAPPEQGRFAIELIRGEAVAVAHGFNDDSPLAGVDSITVSRASPRRTTAGAATAGSVLPTLGELRLAVSDARAVVDNFKKEIAAAPLDDLKAKAKEELARRAGEAKNALGEIEAAAKKLATAPGKARDVLDGLDVGGVLQKSCDEAKRLLQTAIDTRVKSAKDEVAGFATRLDVALLELDGRLLQTQGDLKATLAAAETDLDAPFVLAFAVLDRLEFAGLEAGAVASSRITQVRDEAVRMFGIFAAWREAQSQAREVLDDLIAQASAVAEGANATFAGECVALKAGVAKVRDHLNQTIEGLDTAIRTAKARRGDVPATPVALGLAFDAVVAATIQLRNAIDEERATGAASRPLLSRIESEVDGWIILPAGQIDGVKQDLKQLVVQLESKLETAVQTVEDNLRGLATDAAGQLDAAGDLVTSLAQDWPKVIATIRRGVAQQRAGLHARLRRCGALQSGFSSARDVVRQARDDLRRQQGAIFDTIDDGAGKLSKGALALAQSICDSVSHELDGWRKQLVDFMDAPDFKAMKDEVQAVADVVTSGVGDVQQHLSALERAAQQALGDVADVVENKRAELGRLLTAFDRVQAKGESILQQSDRTLALMRAVGDPPKVEMLDFNRPGVAYVYNALEQHGVKLSPVVAQVNRAASTVAAVGQAADALQDLLGEFGLRVPFRQLGQQLTPDALKDFDLSRIFPQMGGLDLKDLLGGERFPALDGQYGEAIKVSHGFKPEEGRAWLACEVNTPLEEKSGKPRRIFALGPVQLDLLKGHFGADARFEARADGGTSKKVSGAITGDWQLTVYGTRLVTFVETGLHFDDSGRFDFDIQADKIRLADALQYLVQLLKTFGGEVLSKVKPLEEGGQIVGMSAPFTLSIDALEFGAFSISAIQVNCEFTVLIRPDFMFAVRADVNSKMSPFTLAVGTMIGGGYLTSYTQVVPSRREISQRMSIAVMAGIGRPLSVAGVARGHGYLQFGVEIELYFSTRGRGAGGAVIAFVIASGNLVILGIISCNITLRLETRYDTSGGASASGHLSVRIKISFFYTLNVDRSVNYALSGGGGGSYSDSFA